MNKLPDLDLRFFDVQEEMWFVSDYITMLSHALPDLLEAETRRIDSSYDPDDEGMRSVIHSLGYDLHRGVTTRFLTGSVLILAWGVYEAVVGKVADYVASQKRLELSMRDIRGENFLSRARKYYRGVLQFDLHPEASDWDRLSMIGTLRNVVAHANCRLGETKKRDRDNVRDYVSTHPSTALEGDEYLVLTLEYGRDS